VTRHLDFELKQTDWSFMILHYLGLDHVGHIEGPFAPYNIRRKLTEMDTVIRKLYHSTTKNDILLVLSDHGMANEGGHGGSSSMELQTPALFISKAFGADSNCLFGKQEFFDLVDSIKSREQVDLVSTLSCLFDLDVPADNRGVNFVSDLMSSNCSRDNLLLDQIDLELTALRCMRRNFDQLNRQFNLIKSEFDRSQVAEFNKKAVKISEEIESSKSKLSMLVELRESFERFVRRNVHNLDADESKSNEQTFYLVMAILLILNVRLFY
jgi:ethanolaminephosphotransferase